MLPWSKTNSDYFPLFISFQIMSSFPGIPNEFLCWCWWWCYYKLTDLKILVYFNPLQSLFSLMLECSIFAQLTPLFIWDDFNSLLAFLIRSSSKTSTLIVRNMLCFLLKLWLLGHGPPFFLPELTSLTHTLVALALILPIKS